MPYKVQLVQKLKPIDHPMRFRFAKWACDRRTENADFAKNNHLFRWRSFWSRRVCKQAHIHWKADAAKTSHCLLRIFVQRYNWAIFIRYRAILNKFLFTKIEEEYISSIWFQQDGATCHTAEATLDVLLPVFEDCIISRRTVDWPPRS